jgi:hypothetical protein
MPPTAGAASGASGVSQYCTMDGTAGDNQCYGWNDAVVAEFREGMRVCFAEALKRGLTVGVRPHLVRAPAARAPPPRAGPDPGRQQGQGGAASM